MTYWPVYLFIYFKSDAVNWDYHRRGHAKQPWDPQAFRKLLKFIQLQMLNRCMAASSISSLSTSWDDVLVGDYSKKNNGRTADTHRQEEERTGTGSVHSQHLMDGMVGWTIVSPDVDIVFLVIVRCSVH